MLKFCMFVFLAGFSAFTLPLPPHLLETPPKPPPSSSDEIISDLDTINASDQLQITLVDCPGHASLIRTIIGGAQIIDMMLLVIDVNKGTF